MNRLHAFVLASLCLASVVCAQTAAPAVDEAALQERGRALAQRRTQLDAEHKDAMRACYQLFDVTSCRNQARERYIEASRALRTEELAQSAQERALRTAQAQQRLAEKQADAPQRVEQAQEAQQQAQERLKNQAQKQADHAARGQKSSAYLDKQAEAERRREELRQRAQTRDKPRAAPLPSPPGAP